MDKDSRNYAEMFEKGTQSEPDPQLNYINLSNLYAMELHLKAIKTIKAKDWRL